MTSMPDQMKGVVYELKGGRFRSPPMLFNAIDLCYVFQGSGPLIQFTSSLQSLAPGKDYIP